MYFSDWKNVIFFLIFAQNIDCGYTLEPPQWGGSNEYPTIYVLEQKIRKKMYTPVNPRFSAADLCCVFFPINAKSRFYSVHVSHSIHNLMTDKNQLSIFEYNPKDYLNKNKLTQLAQFVAHLGLCSGVLQIRFPGQSHSFSSCQLLVKGWALNTG